MLACSSLWLSKVCEERETYMKVGVSYVVTCLMPHSHLTLAKTQSIS